MKPLSLTVSIGLFSFILCCGEPAPPESSSGESTFEADVDRYIRSLDPPFSGTILMAVGDTILVNKGYGLANRSHAVPNEAETKYLIGSITKQFTAVLILRLVEAGSIELDATIDRYLPDYPEERASKITIHHLLSHTSGIPHHYIGIPRYFGYQDQIFHTPREYMKLFWNAELAHEPGERFTYTSPGYTLLGVIAETVTGRSYAELLTEHVFTPLGMKNTFVDNNLTVRKNVATGYLTGLRGLVLAWQEEESNRLAAGDLMTTTRDLHRFQRVIDYEGDSILSPDFKEKLLETQRPGACYAGRIMTVPYNGGTKKLTIVSTGGSSYGFTGRVDRLIEKDAVMIILSNIQGNGRMVSQIFDHVGDSLLDTVDVALDKNEQPIAPDPSNPARVAPATMASFEGYYRVEDGTVIGVFRRGEKLVRQYAPPQIGPFGRGLSRLELIPRGEHLFELDGRPGAQLHFMGNKDGTSSQLEILRNGELRSTATRLETPARLDLSEYEGAYYSVELQKTYTFTAEGNVLSAPRFLDDEKTTIVPLEKDLFGFKRGFLVFHRDQDAGVRDFTLETDHIDSGFGSTFAMFVKK